MAQVLRRYVALPTDHGSWVFIFSPLLIGLFAGGRWHSASALLIIAATAAFLSRQPITIAVKIFSNRRSRADLPAAQFWMAVYAVIALLAVLGLVWLGYSYVMLLAVPGAPVFAWHLWLVSQRSERRQAGIEIIATGVLALAAPAAYWVGRGAYDPAGWWLFGLTWFQSAASIVYAYLRLAQRDLPAIPPLAERARLASRALAYTTFNVLGVLILSAMQLLPALLWLPFALQWVESLYGALLRPAVGQKPVQIGVRQLIVSILFTVLFIITWR